MSFSPVIILGMHRSGTSLISSLLEQTGLFMGTRKDENNESLFFKDLNSWILREAGAFWDRPENFQFINNTYTNQMLRVIGKQFGCFLRRRVYLGTFRALKYQNLKDIDFPWGWKDPRNTFTIDIWRKVFPRSKVIHIYRNPIDVAASLNKREKVERKRTDAGERKTLKNCIKEYTLIGRILYQYSYRVENVHESIKLWEIYTERALSLESMLDCEVLHIKYEAFLEEPEKQLMKMLEFIDLKSKISLGNELFRSINPERKFAFLEDENLKNVYKEVGNSELMKKLGYNDLIRNGL